MSTPIYLPNSEVSSKYTPHYLPLLIENTASSDLFVTHRPDLPNSFYPLHLGSIYRLSSTPSPKNSLGLFVYSGLNKEAWASIEKNGGYILLDHIVEAFFGRPDVVQRLHDGIAEAGLNADRVVVLNGNMISDERYHAIADDLGIQQRAHVLPYNGCYWLVRAHNQATGARSAEIAARAETARALLDTNRPKRFVSFNGRGRPHRIYIILRMLAEGYLEKGLVSLLGHEADENPSAEEIERMLARYPEFVRLRSAIPSLLARMPLSIDVSRDAARAGSAFTKVLPWASPDPDAYDQAYFSVVVDTSLGDPGTVFLTPIAYKSFMNFSPFIYFGNRGALKALRETGFQTFSPFIDEGYDAIVDDYDRISAAYAEFERLYAMSEAELNDGLRTVWPALEHNYALIHKPVAGDFERDWQARVMKRLPHAGSVSPKLSQPVIRPA